MTREEAIQFLDNMKHEEAGRAIGKDRFYAELMGYHVQALNIAIKALRQEPKTGHWEWVQYDYNPKLGNWHCSECRCVVVECVGKEEKGGIPLHKYCPQCGAKIVEPQETETWNGIHAQITAPKGTFEKIYEDAESEDKE